MQQLKRTLEMQASARSLSSLIRSTGGTLMNGNINPLTSDGVPSDFKSTKLLAQLLNEDVKNFSGQKSPVKNKILQTKNSYETPQATWGTCPNMDKQPMPHLDGLYHPDAPMPPKLTLVVNNTTED